MLWAVPILATLLTFNPPIPEGPGYTLVQQKSSCRLNIGCYKACERRGGRNCNAQCYKCTERY